MQVRAVFIGVVHLSQQESLRILMFNSRIEVTPKLYRYHLSHIITKSIYTFSKPIQSYIFKLLPSIRHYLVLPKVVMYLGIFILKTNRQCGKILSAIRAYPIVELYSFIPIVAVWFRSPRSIACPFSRKLVILAINTFRQLKSLIGVIVKIVVYSILYTCVIIFTKTAYSFRLSNAFIAPCYVVRYYIHYYF